MDDVLVGRIAQVALQSVGNISGEAHRTQAPRVLLSHLSDS